MPREDGRLIIQKGVKSEYRRTRTLHRHVLCVCTIRERMTQVDEGSGAETEEAGIELELREVEAGAACAQHREFLIEVRSCGCREERRQCSGAADRSEKRRDRRDRPR